MKQYLKLDPWCIIEEGFNPENHELSESIFSLGNGHMGQRANFEEDFSGASLQGSYLAGVYYPDKTRVGWWKNGYPEYFAKVLNSTNWIGMNFSFDGMNLDLSKYNVTEFQRILNMKEGYLQRTFTVELTSDKHVKVDTKRFLSMAQHEIGAISYSVIPNFEGDLSIEIYLDGDVMNKDSNYDEKFWYEIEKEVGSGCGSLMMRTKKLDFHICSSMQFEVFQNQCKLPLQVSTSCKEKYVENKLLLHFSKNDTITIYKYVANLTSRDHKLTDLIPKSKSIATEAREKGFDFLFKEHVDVWAEKWKESDIVIEGDVAAQQAIRFNIFQLNQTYTGEDSRLNIGPKGFTGEKYGGSTYWDTEAYCLPFYLSTADSSIAKNLLLYRYNQLDKAKENAKKLGYTKGALYPMVTMNGEECHNEWEITFEEIHRNGAIAYAIYNYVNYTGDMSYIPQYGIDVLVEISRFWEDRTHFAANKSKYVILGVTGPNEYENNVNNNWYTNRIACWTLEYTLETLKNLKEIDHTLYESIVQRLNIEDQELEKWKDIIDNMYYPIDEESGIYLQQDGYMDKEQLLVQDLNPAQLPLNQNWSWDRILRSCFIKQADVLQGLYFFEHLYNLDTIKKNFNFYEPRTVHESSLSPCVHSILAAKIGEYEKAYKLYLRTARLDLDNYNNDTEDGCHITSMAGTWLSIVQGFGGMRVLNGTLTFNPYIPEHWNSYSFKILFRGVLLKIHVDKKEVSITNESKDAISVYIYEKKYEISQDKTIVLANAKNRF